VINEKYLWSFSDVYFKLRQTSIYVFTANPKQAFFAMTRDMYGARGAAGRSCSTRPKTLFLETQQYHVGAKRPQLQDLESLNTFDTSPVVRDLELPVLEV
jgi:hypothetical protein